MRLPGDKREERLFLGPIFHTFTPDYDLESDKLGRQ
jgi:hypothetical protein